MKALFSLLWRGWKRFAHVLGAINTRLLLTATYFVVFAVGALVAFVARADLLGKRDRPGERLRARTTPESSLEACRRQF